MGISVGLAFSAPAVVQRSNGETDVVVAGPNKKSDYYYNFHGQAAWNWLPIAGDDSAHSTPAVVQRRRTGETNVLVRGPNNRLDYYFNLFGRASWQYLLVMK